ncbi:MAG: hypothetical protein OEM52_11940 [bacterium]|nr:hypothetical protein [bacterium]
MNRKQILTPLDWLEAPQQQTLPPLTFIVGSDEWVIDILIDSFKHKLAIEDFEYGFSILYADDVSPEEFFDSLQGSSLLYAAPKLVFLRDIPSGRKEKLRKLFEQTLKAIRADNTYVVWLMDVYDGGRKPKIWPYTILSPQLIIRFDERDDSEMLRWTRYLLEREKLRLSPKSVSQLANSSQFPYELHNTIEQLRLWAKPDGSIDDSVFAQLSFGELDSVVEDVALYLLSGRKKEMLSALNRLDEQFVARSSTTIIWKLAAILHECWHWQLPTSADSPGGRWNPYFRLLKDLEPFRHTISESAIWATLHDLAALDVDLKSTGAFQQEHRLLLQTLVPAVERFIAGTYSRVRA